VWRIVTRHVRGTQSAFVPSAGVDFVVVTAMRSFRARIERGRIIVHEPIDLPDGVVYLVALDKSKGDPASELPVDATATVRGPSIPPPKSDHSSSS
jgi:hypothetical protein